MLRIVPHTVPRVGRSYEHFLRWQEQVEQVRGLEAAVQKLREGGLGGDPPDDFHCPITLAVMTDPVIASDGFSYERAAIQVQKTPGFVFR